MTKLVFQNHRNKNQALESLMNPQPATKPPQRIPKINESDKNLGEEEKSNLFKEAFHNLEIQEENQVSEPQE